MKNENYLIINSLLKSTLNLESNKSNLISYISQKNPSSQLLSQIMSFFNKSKPIEEISSTTIKKRIKIGEGGFGIVYKVILLFFFFMFYFNNDIKYNEFLLYFVLITYISF